MGHESKRLGLVMIAIVAAMVLGATGARAAIVFSDDFSDGDISDWTASGNEDGSWVTSYSDLSNAAIHTGAVVGRLEHLLGNPGQYTSGDWSIEFDYNYFWGNANPGCHQSIGLLDANGDGYRSRIIQSGSGYHGVVTNDVSTNVWQGGGMPALTGYYSADWLQRARVSLRVSDGRLTTDYWNGSIWVNAWTTTNTNTNSFTKIVLWDDINASNARAIFDNITVDSKLVPEPQILPLLGLLGGLVLRRRK